MTAAQILERIKSFCSPMMDRGDAHGPCGQSGRILWASSEGFAIAAIEKALADAAEVMRARCEVMLRKMAEDVNEQGDPGGAALSRASDAIAALKVESVPLDFGPHNPHDEPRPYGLGPVGYSDVTSIQRRPVGDNLSAFDVIRDAIVARGKM